MSQYPKKILHWIEGVEVASAGNLFFPKYNPATGEILAEVARGAKDDADRALAAAEHAYQEWSRVNIVARADILREATLLIRARREEVAQIVAQESGKPKKIALGEIDAAIECGFFFAGEGRRYFGEVLTSAVPNRTVQMIRQSIGVGALITPFNNPMSGIAWKAFPALLCGNTVVMKSHEDTPYAGVWFGKILREVGLPSGAFSVVQGLGPEAGAPIIEDDRVKFISFTGSIATGRVIVKAAADRLAKVSIEAGGKNPFVVCDDADLEKAVAVAVSSAFVDGGQRCSAASRIIIFDAVYRQFKKLFLERVGRLKIGTADTDDFGAIINQKRVEAILESISGAVSRGAALLAGGHRITDAAHKAGYFIAPTVLENVDPADEVSCNELFGPVAILYRVKDFNEAVDLANRAEFKLSGAIHTQSIHRAEEFIARYHAGVVRVNGPTHGSEAHMPFGGMGLSGNGWREPGANALDFYSEWKQVSVDHDSALT